MKYSPNHLPQTPNTVESFWREKLSAHCIPTPLVVNLPKDHARPLTPNRINQSLSFSSSESEGLSTFLCQNQMTVDTVIVAAWSLLLNRYSAQENILFGLVDNTPDGPLLTPISININHDDSIVNWLESVQITLQQFLSATPLPLKALQELSDIPNSSSFFESVVICNPSDQYSTNTENENTYPLRLEVTTDKQFSLNINYCKHSFTNDIVLRMLEHVKVIIQTLCTSNVNNCDEFAILSSDEVHQFKNFNDTDTHYQESQSLLSMFTDNVLENPDKTAVISERYNGGRRDLSFIEIDRKAQTLANELIQSGVKPGDKVAICLPRSEVIPITILAVFYAGACYLPIDPNYPTKRIAYVLEDANATHVVTNERFSPLVTYSTTSIIDINSALAKPFCHVLPVENPLSTKDTLAFLIYTSGSTGKPKGVMVSQSNLTNFIVAMSEKPGLSANDRILALTTISFDIAVLEILLPLAIGATTVIANEVAIKEPLQLANMIAEYDITLMQATPTTWRLMIDAGWQGAPKLTLLTGGEALSPELADQLLARADTVWNMYGPTETTVWSSCYQIQTPGAVPLIGKPIANTQLYVLDKHFNQVPINVPGELFIGGDGVSQGYFGKTELSAERFIQNPFSEQTDSLIYRTGDLVKFTESGDIGYLSRLDDQVKIRGFRIELGEIESALLTQPIIKDCVVIASDTDASKRLLAYLIIEPEHTSHAENIDMILRQTLAQQLPDYMIPSVFMVITEFPKTPNGKLNRLALPSPDRLQTQGSQDTTPLLPNSSVEKVLCNMWQQYLELDEISINTNFISLGGNSLTATQVASNIRNVFDLDVSVQACLNPNVHTLSVHLLELADAGNFDLEESAEFYLQMSNLSESELEALLQSDDD